MNANINEDGLIVKGVNTTKDVGLDELTIQAHKLGFTIAPNGELPRARPDGKFSIIYDTLVNS